MALPSTTAEIAVQAGSILTIFAESGQLTIPDGHPAPDGTTDENVAYPARITTPGGARIAVVDVADISLPQGTVVASPRRLRFALKREWDLQVPGSNDAVAASFKLVMIQAAVAIFGIAAMIGIVGVLVYGFSELSRSWRLVTLIGLLLLDALVLWYAVGTIRRQFKATT
jgi:hypothetical protein